MMIKNPEICKSHASCLLCGDQNPYGFNLKFERHADGYVYSKFHVSSYLQGYSGILHGGVISALLDSAMIHCLFERHVEGVTGEIKVRYRKPVPVNVDTLLQAYVLEEHAPLYKVKAKLLLDNKLMAWSDAKFMDRNYNYGNPI